MNLPELTHEEEVNLERFANLMIELIEKHADAVDKDEMNVFHGIKYRLNHFRYKNLDNYRRFSA